MKMWLAGCVSVFGSAGAAVGEWGMSAREPGNKRPTRLGRPALARTRESASVLTKKPNTSRMLNRLPSSWRPVSWASRSCAALRAGKWLTG
jgi:hypothetical protein